MRVWRSSSIDTVIDEEAELLDWRFIGVPNKFSNEFLGEDFAAAAAGFDFPPPE